MEYVPPDSEARVHAERALAEVHRLGRVERRAVYNPSLNRALEPLRLQPAVGIRCAHCQRGLGWCAVQPGTAVTAATQARSAPKQRHGGITDLYDPAPNAPLRRALPWIELAETGATTVTISDWRNPAGYPMRVTFTCRCGANYPTTNTLRITQYLTVISRGQSTIWL